MIYLCFRNFHVDALKELAYRVTEYSNDEDGVAKTLEKILKA